MKLVPVVSSNLSAVGYDPDRRALRVAFKSGSVHDHMGVSPEEHSALMAADSHGKHYNEHIKGRYASLKAGGAPMEDDPPQGAVTEPERKSVRGEERSLDAAIRRYVQEGDTG